MAAVSIYVLGAVEITKTYNHWLVKLHELSLENLMQLLFSALINLSKVVN